MNDPTHVMSRKIGVIGDLEPELRDAAAVLDADALDQSLPDLSSIGARLSRHDQPTQAQPAPGKRRDQECAQNEEDLLEHVPLVELRQQQDDQYQNEELYAVHDEEPTPRQPRARSVSRATGREPGTPVDIKISRMTMRPSTFFIRAPGLTMTR